MINGMDPRIIVRAVQDGLVLFETPEAEAAEAAKLAEEDGGDWG